MNCPHCQASQPRKLDKTTDLGYALFHCRRCKRKFNERTGSPFNYLEFPTDIVFQVVLCRLRYKLSLRDLAEMFLLRGFEFTHETVREWEERFAPLLAEYVRGKRKGKCGRRWYVDETYLRIKGKWCYLYRAIDRAGNLVDSMLSETARHGVCQGFLPGCCLRYGEDSAPSNERWPRFVSARHPRGTGSSSRASLQRLLESADRARSPRRETALLPDVGFRCFPVSPTLLSGVRGNPAILSTAT
jgi:transposase-like protein